MLDYSEEFINYITIFTIVIILFLLICCIGYLIFYFIGMFKLYKKSGKGGWECFIPFYSTFVLTEISGLNWWWFLIAECGSLVILVYDSSSITGILSLASLLARINIYYNLSKKYHKDTAWIVLTVFFGGIVIPVLGYSSKDVYDYNIKVSKNGFFDTNNNGAV